MITKEQIQNRVEKPELKTFQSETLGGDVMFKKMSAAGNYAIESQTTVFYMDGTRSRDFTYLRQALIAFSQVDDQGRLIWDVRDIRGTLSELDPEIIEELFGFASEMNPSKQEDENAKEELAKNPEGSSSTD